MRVTKFKDLRVGMVVVLPDKDGGYYPGTGTRVLYLDGPFFGVKGDRQMPFEWLWEKQFYAYWPFKNYYEKVKQLPHSQYEYTLIARTTQGDRVGYKGNISHITRLIGAKVISLPFNLYYTQCKYLTQ